MGPGSKDARGSGSAPPNNSSAITSAAYRNLPERDDDLDDHDLNDGHFDNLPDAKDRDKAVTADSKMTVHAQDPKGVKKLGVVANAIASCAALSFFSITMILVNKALAATFNVNYTFLPMAFQCLVAVLFVESARFLGLVHYEPFKLETAARWSPIAVFFCLMIWTSFSSMRYMNVPMITVFKSLTNLMIVAGDYFWHKQPVTIMILLSLAFMTVGAIFAAWNDIAFSAWGYFFMSANCFATASYVLTMKFATKTIKLPKFGMVFYNNLLGFLIMVPIAVMKGELFTFGDEMGFLAREDLHSFRYISFNVFAGAAGFLLNFAALWCVSATSATTYAVVNTVNNCPVSIIGYFLFSSVVTRTQWEFIVVNIIGGFIYSAGKIQQQKKKQLELLQRDNEVNGDVEAVPLVSGTQQEDGYKRSPSSRRT